MRIYPYHLFFLFVHLFTLAHKEIVFPKYFLKGVGLSAFQNGGHKWGYSNWAWFQDTFIHLNAKTFCGPSIKNNEHVGYACGFWDNAINDVELIKQLGCTSFRFSVEWSEIEPIEGHFNEAAFVFYDQLINELIRNDIKPMITLYHFVHPYWFEHIGGFEKTKNIAYFVRYCQEIFKHFGHKVNLWCTINEPTVSAACGYILGIHPPGNVVNFHKAGIVLRNLLNAHVEVYHALKPMPYDQNVQIGLVHQLLQAEAYNPKKSSLWFIGLLKHISGIPLAKFLNFSFAHEIVKEFLKTGHFSYRIPGLINIEYQNSLASQSYDFIGLNYYSKVIFGPGPTAYPGNTMTDMDYPMRPDTFYDAIVEISELGKPIYITENGIADAHDNNRAQFIIDYISIVDKALKDGYDIRGYYFWTLMDNFEWNDGYTMKFGLYDVDFDTQKRTLRNGAKPYRDIVKIQS